MFQYLYDWIKNISFYLVLVTALLNVLPDSGYKRYIRFFTGILLMLMVMAPILNILGSDGQIDNFYKSREYETKMKEIEESTRYLEEPGIDSVLSDMDRILAEDEENGERKEKSNIEVGEIQVER